MRMKTQTKQSKKQKQFILQTQRDKGKLWKENEGVCRKGEAVRERRQKRGLSGWKGAGWL